MSFGTAAARAASSGRSMAVIKTRFWARLLARDCAQGHGLAWTGGGRTCGGPPFSGTHKARCGTGSTRVALAKDNAAR
jgi:hypothetical protein